MHYIVTDKISTGEMHRNFFATWIKTASEKWKLSETPNPHLFSFALHLTKFVCKKEQLFVALNSDNVFENLLLENDFKNERSPIVKLAYVQLMLSFLAHKSGLQWIISMNNWSNVLDIILSSNNVYISRDGCKFLSLFVIKCVVINEKYCLRVMEKILEPITKRKNNESEDTTYYTIKPTLHTICEVLENFLQEVRICEDNKLIYKIITMFNIGIALKNLSPTSNKGFIFDVNQTLMRLDLFDFILRFGNLQMEAVPYDKASKLTRCVSDKLIQIIEKTNTAHVLTALLNNLKAWTYVSSQMPVFLNADKEPVSYEVQVQLLQIFPVFMYITNLVGIEEFINVKDEYRELFYAVLVKGISEETFRAHYVWRKKLGSHVSVSDACLSLKCVAHSQKYYTKEAANSAFPSLIYCLIDILKCIEKNVIVLPMRTETSGLLEILIATIIGQLKEFNITWKYGVESVCVLETALKCLKIFGLPTRVSYFMN